MISQKTAGLLLDIVKRVYETEREHDEESIYWPEEREEWNRIVRRAKRELHP